MPDLPIHVRVDWSGPGHYDPDRSMPCRCCKTPTKMRDQQGRPCHQGCAEDELAREIAGGQLSIPDERVAPSATPLGVRR